MAEGSIHVTVTADVSRFVEALERVHRSAWFPAFLEGWRHARRHHGRETPAASAMHAAYDRRRRARRRRNR